MKKLALGATMSAVFAVAHIPCALAAGPELRPTQVVIQNISDVDAVTADGRYLYIVQSATGSRKQAAWIEDMNGQRWNIPQVNGTAPLLGTETGGVFVFDHVAGSGPIAFAFQPGVGVRKGFINHHDPFAHSMYGAVQSSKGHWAAYRTNAAGGWGPDVFQWVDIDDTPIPVLPNVETFAWAPNGSQLGYFTRRDDTGEGWIGVYNLSTRYVQLLGEPFKLSARSPVILQGWQSTGVNSAAPSMANIQWSPNGQWLATQAQGALQVCSLAGGQGSTVPVQNDQNSLWGWTPDGHIYVVEDTTVSIYANQGGHKWALLHQLTAPEPVTRAVSTPFGLLMGTDGGALYRLTGTSISPAVAGNVSAWWFDTQNGSLYVLPASSSSGRMYSVKLG